MPGPLTPYAYQTRAQVVAALLQRLNSTGSDFWTTAECQLYLEESLRVWNCLTQTWIADFTVTLADTDPTWQSLGSSQNSLVGPNPTSPRVQTLTSTYLYTFAEYMLLEPPTGASWTGTPQFQITDLSQALQRRRDAILQATACNVGPFSNSFSLPPGNQRVYLPDFPSQSILDIRRVRFIPTIGPPSTLYREDGLAIEYFENDFTTSNQSTPFAWDVLAGPPLALTFDAAPAVPNTLDILAMISGGLINPVTPSPLLIPDDWNWVLKYGMLSDLLRKESESVDLERADYCEKRFQEGIQLMLSQPWLLQARINNIPVDTPSIVEMDDFANEWQSDPNAPLAIVRGGIDLFAISPAIPVGESRAVTLSLVGNAPIPATDGDFVQVSRDVLDYILDEAQHIAAFKHGGFDWAETTRTLHKNFLQMAVQTNARLAESGIFATTLRPPISRQAELMPRFATQGEG